MTAPPVLFPDSTSVAVGWLRQWFTDRAETAPVGQRVPSPRPDRFVTIARTGGVRSNVVTDKPLLTVEAWGSSDEQAHDLAQLARTGLHAMRGRSVAGVAVYRINEAGGPVNLPDPVSQQSRYTFTLEVAMRGAPLDP
jgi:hypothetical protein